MAHVEPFQGIRYNPEKVGDLNRVVAPPYDIIPEKLQEQLYEKNPNNVIRLELNRTTPRDNEGNNRYTRAAKHLQDWIENQILIQEESPAIYNYSMDYSTMDGEKKRLKGFFVRLRLEEFDKGVVLPHEKTLSGPKADRLKLMEYCHANFSPIFALYSNPDREITPILDRAALTEPLIHVTDFEGVDHQVWAIQDPDAIRKIQDVLADRPLFIADGHHRYETALAYRDVMREKTGKKDGQQPFDYIMTYLSNMEEPGLTIYPTHRLIHHLQNFQLDHYLDQIKTYFEIQSFSFTKKREFYQNLKSRGGERPCFGLYTTQSDDLFILTLKNHKEVLPLIQQELSTVLKEMDVTILHTVLLDHFLGIGEKELKAQSHVRYVKNAEDALHTVNDGDAQLAFLLNATRMDQLRNVSLAKEVMPQKSTYFYPKLLTGLVLNSLR